MLSRLCLISVLVLSLSQVSCNLLQKKPKSYIQGPDTPPASVIKNGVAITLRDQKLTFFQEGKPVREYPISSSKFGISSNNGSHHTPLGIHAVHSKYGEGQPKGMVFKGCRPTGEVVSVDALGRDPIVTRVIPLTGLEKGNKNSYRRRIYLHGTPEERFIGAPASYGCIRMRSDDIIDLYRYVGRGTIVAIESCSQNMYKQSVASVYAPPAPAETAKDSASGLPVAKPQDHVAKNEVKRGVSGS